jgi:hypothetical protein
MNRSTFVFALAMIALVFASPSHAIETFNESFNFSTLDRRLEVSATSNAFTAASRNDGMTWELSKQAGTTAGSIELQTRFRISGNFTALLGVNRASLGTGEVGIRIGETGTPLYAEIYLQDLDEVRGIVSQVGGHGIAGFDTNDATALLRIIRNGDQITYSHNGQNFLITDLPGDMPVSVFLRPFSGSGLPNPNIGFPDAHTAILEHFMLSAEAFVPEPATATIALLASCMLTLTTRRRRQSALVD